jgi:transposase
MAPGSRFSERTVEDEAGWIMARGRGGRARARRQASPAWTEFQARLIWPEQLAYEEIRPVVALGQPIKDRADEVGVSAKTLSRKVERFVQHGIPGLIPNVWRRTDDQRLLPQPVRDYILQLKVEYPRFTSREIASICEVKFDRTLGHHTVERVLARHPLPKVTGRRYPRYYTMRDVEERREALLRLHLEGWTIKAIVGYLGVPRRTLYNFLKRWADDGVKGLSDRQRGRQVGARKVTLPVVATVKELQETSAIGEFRMAAALKQRYGIELSPRTCGRIMAKHRALDGLQRPTLAPKPKKPMPFAATRPHQFWSVDICSIEQHHVPRTDGPIYIITFLDNYSRSIVASAPSKKQDLWAFLLVFFTAIHVPEALVSDGGSVFKANHALEIYDRLAIRKEQIEHRKPWQDYVESHFAVMKRMEAYQLEHALSWEQFCDVHARFVADYNHQEHCAHQGRTDGRRTPAEVLKAVRKGYRTGLAATSSVLRRVEVVNDRMG